MNASHLLYYDIMYVMNEGNADQNNLYVYVDESGSITKADLNHHKYFVVAMVFTNNPIAIRRLFKKKISQLMRKNNLYRDMILSAKEIKGSDLSESTKSLVYEHIFKYADENMEIGLIVLDNRYTTDKFIENHPRAFNYILQVYLDSCFRHHSRYMTGTGKIEFIIDEQNIATNAKFTLEGYLNQQLSVYNPICDQFSVSYTDSKREKLVQLTDFIANTVYRNLEKHDIESVSNIQLMMPYICKRDVFDFSASHDLHLWLPA